MMKRNFLKELNASFATDKRQHFIIGMVVSGASLLVLHNIVIQIIITAIVGILIEYCQSFTKDRCVESGDIFATISGGQLVSLVYCFIVMLL